MGQRVSRLRASRVRSHNPASKYPKMWASSLRPTIALFLFAGLSSVNAKLALKTPKYSLLSDSGSVLKSDSYVEYLSVLHSRGQYARF